MRQGISLVKRRVAEVEALGDVFCFGFFDNADRVAAQTASALILETLADVFAKGTLEYERYSSAANLYDGAGRLDREGSVAVLQKAISYLEEKLLLEQAMEKLDIITFEHKLPQSLLGNISKTVLAPFSRGEFSAAILLAMIAVEVSVRQFSNLPAKEIGTSLMRKAFEVGDGPLTDKSTERAEQQALSDLFAGVIGCYKNRFRIVK